MNGWGKQGVVETMGFQSESKTAGRRAHLGKLRIVVGSVMAARVGGAKWDGRGWLGVDSIGLCGPCQGVCIFPKCNGRSFKGFKWRSKTFDMKSSF